MEDRIARLEARVEHIQSDIPEMKTDIRDLRTQAGEGKDAVTNLARKIEKYTGVDRVWWLVIAATLLGVMAHGFKWL